MVEGESHLVINSFHLEKFTAVGRQDGQKVGEKNYLNLTGLLRQKGKTKIPSFVDLQVYSVIPFGKTQWNTGVKLILFL